MSVRVSVKIEINVMSVEIRVGDVVSVKIEIGDTV